MYRLCVTLYLMLVLLMCREDSESVESDLSEAETSRESDGEGSEPGKEGPGEKQMPDFESDDDFSHRPPTRTRAVSKPVPSRQQPRRSRGAATVCLKEDSGTSEGNEQKLDTFRLLGVRVIFLGWTVIIDLNGM
jgi:hypothetical protein